MQLDITTLAALVAFVAVITGAILLVTALVQRGTVAPAVWGYGNCMLAIGMVLTAEGGDARLVFFCYLAAAGLVWGAATAFHGRRVPPFVLVAAAAIWALLSFAPVAIPAGWRIALYLVPILYLLLSAAHEIWRGRAERLGARWPLLALVLGHSTTVLGGLVTALVNPDSGLEISDTFSWVALMETLLFIIGTAVCLVAMLKERSIAEHQKAASTDAMTGIANRGAFVAAAREALAQASTVGRPVSAILFDLDSFKLVNDTFGHRFGDAVIQRFAQVASRATRRGDLVGRVGGEEFAMLLPGTGPEAAVAIAERILLAFAEAAAFVDGRAVNATASAGVACTETGEVPAFDDLLDRADQALYGAKARGRNRVHAGGRERGPAGQPVALKIA